MVTAVDIGTTSAKAVAFDGRARPGEARRAAYALREPAAGRAEQDPQEVLDAVAGLVPARGEVAFATAMHSLVGVGADGRPRTPLITWADTRAAAQAERLARERPHLHERTGTPLHPMSPLAKLVWLREHEPETHRAVRRWCGVKELVVHRLTGEWATDHSTASGTGLLDLHTLDWDAEALEVAGIDATVLPELRPPSHRIGRFVLGAADGPLANAGVGATVPGVAACSIGTSAAVRLTVDAPAHTPETFCYGLTPPGRWVVGGAITNGGAVLQWVRDALAPELTPAQLLELAATAPPGSDGLVMRPLLRPERAPHWRPGATGAFLGLRSVHRRPHLIRAALEGVCEQLALVLAGLREAGLEVREIRATGGFARSPFWRQLLADVVGAPLGFPAGSEGSALGAALLAMGEIDRAAQLVPVLETVEPEPAAAALYEERRRPGGRAGRSCG